jgi:GH24 family phage-related lysozyme (muramidase)
MKTEFNKVCAILMFLLFLKIENNNLHKRNYSKINYTFEENDSLKVYNECIEELKEREKFISKVYRCPAGYKTIGYGHRLLKGERFKVIDSIQALKILKEDFNKAFTEINTKFKDSTYNWKLAHAHFAFCLGMKNAKEAIKNKSIHKYVYYRKNNRYIKAESLIRARQFELALISNI